MIDREKVEEFCRFFDEAKNKEDILGYALAITLAGDKTKFFEYINHISKQHIGKKLSQEDILAVWLYMLKYGKYGLLELRLTEQYFHRKVFPSEYPYTVQVYTRSAGLSTFSKRVSAGVKGDKEYYIMGLFSKALNKEVYKAITNRINPEEIKLIISSYPQNLEVEFWASGFLYRGFHRLEDALEFILNIDGLLEKEEERKIALYRQDDISISFPDARDYWWSSKGMEIKAKYLKTNYRVFKDKVVSRKSVEIQSVPISDLTKFLGDKAYVAEYIERLLDFGEVFFQEIQEVLKRRRDVSVDVEWADEESIKISGFSYAKLDNFEVEEGVRDSIVKAINERNLYPSRFLQEKMVSIMRAISI